MKNKLGVLMAMAAMATQFGDERLCRSEEPDPLKRNFRKGNYVPEPKRPLSKKQKRNRKLGRR